MISWRGQINEMLRHDADYAEVAQPEVDTHHSRTLGDLGLRCPQPFPFPTTSISKISKSPISPSSNKTCQDPAAPLAPAVLQPCSPGPADCNYPATGTTGHRCVVACSNFDIDHCCNIDIHNLEEVLFLVESASSKSFL